MLGGDRPIEAYVIGAGSIGLFLQFLLQKEIGSMLVARQESCTELERNPLRITGAVEGRTQVPCTTLDDIQRFHPSSTIFVATKAFQVEPLLKMLQPKLQDTNTVVLCQNGIGLYDIARKTLPEQRLLRLSCWMGTQRLALAHVHVAGIYKFDIAAPNDAETLLRFWQRVLIASGVNTTVTLSPHLSEWQKALWNIAVNGVCAIADGNNGVILDYPELREISVELLAEARRVANRAEVQLKDEDFEAVFSSLEKTRDNVNATLQDLRAGREPELEFLNGAVVNLAQQYGEHTPMNRAVLGLVSYLRKTKKREKAAAYER